MSRKRPNSKSHMMHGLDPCHLVVDNTYKAIAVIRDYVDLPGRTFFVRYGRHFGYENPALYSSNTRTAYVSNWECGRMSVSIQTIKTLCKDIFDCHYKNIFPLLYKAEQKKLSRIRKSQKARVERKNFIASLPEFLRLVDERIALKMQSILENELISIH